MLNINQVEKYNELRLISEIDADIYAQSVVSAMNLKTPLERGQIWDEFKQQMNKEKISSKRLAAKAKREARKGKISIKKVCAELLLKSGLSGSERVFLSDISNKRKLTVKQEKWFLAIAKNNNVKAGEIERKTAKIIANCNHDDLGSLGYTHGTIVKCPHCGNSAEVW